MFKTFMLTITATSLLVLTGCGSKKCCSTKECVVVQEEQPTQVVETTQPTQAEAEQTAKELK